MLFAKQIIINWNRVTLNSQTLFRFAWYSMRSSMSHSGLSSLFNDLEHMRRIWGWLSRKVPLFSKWACRKRTCVQAWIIERLDRKLLSRGLISYRRLVGSCSKMALDGSIIVEICDETMAKMWRKPVEM